jgi:3-phenylpropionate/trans-cinnamate dioxygenase ferredoxin reductase subunit
VSRGTLDDLDLDWRLGESATGLDLAAQSVLLAGGERLRYDGLVIATGASPKRLPGTDHLDGVHTLRSLDDCEAIRAALAASPRRVAVVGAGFIGAEVAATCRGLGIEVSMIEALPVPLERGLGPAMGAVVAGLHRDHGVDVRLGVGVVLIEGGDRVERIRLTDGTVLDVDLVVIGIGVGPNTGWLAGSGLTIDNGVLCDATCAAAPGVVAAGDVARWPNHRFGEVMRVEHWDNAIAMGTHAARTLVAGPAQAEPYVPVPWFWSDQYDRKIQLAGRAGPDDVVEVVSGSVEERRFVAFYGRAGRLVGVLGMSQPAKVMRWRALVEQAATWDAALAAARQDAA